MLKLKNNVKKSGKQLENSIIISTDGSDHIVMIITNNSPLRWLNISEKTEVGDDVPFAYKKRFLNKIKTGYR